jgi:hypothetical protein
MRTYRELTYEELKRVINKYRQERQYIVSEAMVILELLSDEEWQEVKRVAAKVEVEQAGV